MSFLWPDLLWSLLLLPLLVLLYVWLLRKRRRSPVRLASVAVAKAALGKGPGWRRHVPPLLLLLAIGTLLVAMARPIARERFARPGSFRSFDFAESNGRFPFHAPA